MVRTTIQKLIGFALIFLIFSGAAYIRRGPVPTVEDPEATTLIGQTRGFILIRSETAEESPQGSTKISAIKSSVETISFPARLILGLGSLGFQSWCK